MLNLNTTAAQVPQEVARLDATTQRQLNANAAVLVRGAAPGPGHDHGRICDIRRLNANFNFVH